MGGLWDRSLRLGGLVVEVGGGDLECVEEEAGAAGVDVVVSDAGDELAEGVLDGSAAGGFGELEGVAARLAELRVGDWFAGGVVVVAEALATHRR